MEEAVDGPRCRDDANGREDAEKLAALSGESRSWTTSRPRWRNAVYAFRQTQAGRRPIGENLAFDQADVTGAWTLCGFLGLEVDAMALQWQLENSATDRAAMKEMFNAAVVADEADRVRVVLEPAAEMRVADVEVAGGGVVARPDEAGKRPVVARPGHRDPRDPARVLGVAAVLRSTGGPDPDLGRLRGDVPGDRRDRARLPAPPRRQGDDGGVAKRRGVTRGRSRTRRSRPALRPTPACRGRARRSAGCAGRRRAR